jgi:hypothetical protein
MARKVGQINARGGDGSSGSISAAITGPKT